MCATQTAERVNKLVYRRMVMDDLLLIICLKDAELENNVKMYYLLNRLFIIFQCAKCTVDNTITVLYAVKNERE